MSGGYQPKGRIGTFVHNFEETVIALLMGLMTMVTFVNVVLRYGFNSMLIWGLELVLVLFAWLVLFGIAYGFKVVSHLGVDALVNMTGSRTKRVLGILSGLVCLLYAIMLLKGGWDYWAPFAGFDATSGRWFPTGFENSRDNGWYETDQLPIPFGQTWLENTFNMGEPYGYLPRFVPYFILPLSMALMTFRIVQLVIRLIRGDIDVIIVSHEAEDAVEEAGKDLSKET